MSINWIDVVFALIFLAAIIYGLVSGFVMQLANVLALVLGIFAGGRFGDAVGSVLGYVIQSEAWCHFLGFALVFIVVAGGLRLLAWLIRGFLRKLPLTGTWDRALGAIAAALAAFLLCLALSLMGVHAREGRLADAMERSLLAPRIVHTADVVRVWISEQRHERIQEFLERWREWRQSHS